MYNISFLKLLDFSFVFFVLSIFVLFVNISGLFEISPPPSPASMSKFFSVLFELFETLGDSAVLNGPPLPHYILVFSAGHITVISGGNYYWYFRR